MSESSARIGIYADDKASPTVKSVQGHMQGLAAEAKKSILTGVGLAGGVAAFSLLQNAAGAAVNYLGDAIGAASKLNESQAKAKVVFGASSAEIEKWAKTMASSFGISTQAALEAAGTYGNLFQAFGMGQEEATKMSKTLVELAADLASFNNTSVDDALVALRSGLSGETEPLKRYGIAISDARMRTELAAQGFTNLGGTLTPLQKTTAAYALIMKDSALAQGDSARSSGNLAMVQKKLDAEMADLSAEIGQQLLPILKDLTVFARQTLIPTIRAIGDVIGTITDPLKASEDGVTDWVDVLSVGLDQLTGGPLRRWGEGFKTTAEGVVVDAGNLSRQAANVLTSGAGAVAAGAKVGITDPIWQAGYDAKQKAQQEAAKIPKAMGDAILAAEKDLTDSVKTLLTFLDEALTPAQEAARARAFLTSQAYADALASGKPAAVAKAAELANAALVVLWGATASGAAAGSGVGNAWVSGLNAALAQGYSGQTYTWIQKYTKLLKMAGSPDYTHAIEAGVGVAKGWLGGVNKTLGRGTLNLPSLKDGTLNLPSVAAGSRLGVPGGGVAPSGLHIHFEGPVYGDGPFLDKLARTLAQRLNLVGVT